VDADHPQGWLVWELTKSEAELGKVAMLGALPLLVLGPWAGTLADRYNRRQLLIVTQIAAMVLAFIMALLVQFNVAQIWHVYILATLLGVVTAVDFPALQAFLGDLTGMGQIRKAVVVNATLLQIARMIGPALAGFVIGATGIATAFWINGVSFIAVIASLLAIRTMAEALKVQGISAQGPNGGFKAAWNHVTTQPRLVDLILFAIMMTFFGLSIINIMASVADTVLHGDASTLGLMLGASGAGALISTLVITPIAQSFKRTGLVVAGGAAWTGVWFLAMSFCTKLPPAMVCIFLGSIGAPLVLTTALGLMQVMSPGDMRARIVSLFTTVTFGMQPISALMVGYSAEFFGTATAVMLNGIALVLAPMLLLLLRPSLRLWEVAPATEAAPAQAAEGVPAPVPEATPAPGSAH
jgi:MFS family permease